MDFTQLMIDALAFIAKYVGSYGWAIVVLTFIVRAALWGVNVQQQVSMRKMQSLQPKMKALQDRYKNNPQMLQQKMMEFYKDNKFNPFSGCLPLIIQLPIFIMLYSALMSPQFIQMAGNSSFLCLTKDKCLISRLDNTLKSTSGTANDGIFGIREKDTFSIPKTIDVTMKDGSTMPVKIDSPQKALQIQGDMIPGENVDFKIPLDNLKLKFEQLNNVESTKIPVINNSTKEVETMEFTRNESNLISNIKTVKTETKFHIDVLFLVLLFGASMWFATKFTTSMTKGGGDPTQQAMQKTMGTTMPIMVTAMFVFFPIPAGVLLYLIVSNVIQIAQTVIVNKQLDAQEAKKSEIIDKDVVNNAKKIEPKSITDDKQD
ncbi:MAG: YidC/Oxa1 family membrane protein insertase [Candidatus Gastranaerophilales bacterium]|nr:YidC/Oxa1 family membrane protein insertase [Candidatus Gastranaerophilales bacterium]